MPAGASARRPARGTASRCSTARRPERGRRPSPARTSSSDDVDPSRTADACAPRNSDSAVCSGEVRRIPRSRNIASIPSRVAANAEGTPSSSLNQASGSGAGALIGRKAIRYFRAQHERGESITRTVVRTRRRRLRPGSPLLSRRGRGVAHRSRSVVGPLAGPRAGRGHRQAHRGAGPRSATRSSPPTPDRDARPS